MTVINKINKNYKRSQKGRSMVEMLGVLAIVGVLSVGGISAYGVAMKKHKANELLHQASMLATDISTKILTGKPLGNITDFGSSSNGTFSETVGTPNDEQFTMQINDVDEAVCKQLQSMNGGMVRQVECGTADTNGKTTATLKFNNDLTSKAVAGDNDGNQSKCEDLGNKYCAGSGSCVSQDKECGCSGKNNGCQICDTTTGSLVADDEKEGVDCTTSDGKEGTCSDGVCEEKQTCLTSGSCTNNSGLCPGYYCEVSGTLSEDSETGEEYCGDSVFTLTSGTIQSLGIPQRTSNPDYLKSSKEMNWDSAMNYCTALKTAIDEGVDGYSEFELTHGRLALLPSGCHLEDICSDLDVASGSGFLWINANKFCQWDCSWDSCSSTDNSSSVGAFAVDGGYVTGDGRTSGYYALCE